MLVDVGDPKSSTSVVEEVRRVVGVLRVVLLSIVSVVESSALEELSRSSRLAVEVADEDLVVEYLVEEAALVEEEALVEEGVEDTTGELSGPVPVSFVQSFVLSLQRYPRSQHRPDWQIGPPLQLAPLHMG